MMIITIIIIILCFEILLQKSFASLVEMINWHWNREYWTRIGMKVLQERNAKTSHH
jgi:hypothetical protein